MQSTSSQSQVDKLDELEEELELELEDELLDELELDGQITTVLPGTYETALIPGLVVTEASWLEPLERRPSVKAAVIESLYVKSSATLPPNFTGTATIVSERNGAFAPTPVSLLPHMHGFPKPHPQAIDLAYMVQLGCYR